MTETLRFGVFLWSEPDRRPPDEGEPTNKIQLAHRDDPTQMPDEWKGIKPDYDGTTFTELQDRTWNIITKEDRYGDLQELMNVETGYYRKLGEVQFQFGATGTSYAGYTESPPSYEDTAGDNLVHLKPRYANWRALAV